MKNKGKTKAELLKELEVLREERGKGVFKDIAKSIQVEKELRDSEERLKILFDYAPDAYYINDLKGNFIDGNKAAERLMGYKKEELVGKSFLKLNLLTLADIPRAAKLIVKNLRGQPTGPDEFVLKRKDKSKVTVEISTYPVKIKQKTLVLGIARDITERKRVEDALRESEARFNEAQRIAQIGNWELDLIANTLYWSDEVYRMFNLEPQQFEATYEAFLDNIHPDDRAFVNKSYTDSLKNKIPYNIVHRLLLKDGTLKFVNERCETFYDGAGKAVRSVGTVQDITERKKAEEELGESEEKFRTLVTNTEGIVYMIAKDGTILLSEGRGLSEIGVKPGQNVGKSVFEIYKDYPDLLDKIRKAFKGETVTTEVNIGGVYLRNWYTPHINNKGEIIGLLGLSVNITEQKQAVQKLRESESKARAIINASLIAIVLLNKKGIILDSNEEMARRFRMIRNGMIGKCIWDLLPESVTKHRKEQGDYVFKTGKSFHGEDERQGIWNEYFIEPVRFEKGGRIEAVVVEALDVTERKQSQHKLQKTMDATIDTMSKIIEAKDPYTSGHQYRVCQLAVSLAQEMKLPKDKIEGIRIASLIHDIGKIGLPTEILSKPTKLTDIEFSLIKNHSQIGYDILKSIDFSYPVAQIVLQHHERTDGSGYPNKIKGDEILLEAKIIGVADVVEAMSSHRPYRPALGIDKALEEIIQYNHLFSRSTLRIPEHPDHRSFSSSF